MSCADLTGLVDLVDIANLDRFAGLICGLV